MLSVNWRSSSSSYLSPPHLNFTSTPENGQSGSILNMSPRLSSYFNPIVRTERTLPDQASLCWDSRKAVGCSINSIPSDGTPTPKSTAELKEEIATLEVEIMHLERYLLSLYRTAFDGNQSTLSNTPEPYSHYKTRSSQNFLSNQLHYKMEPHVGKGDLVHHDEVLPAHGWPSSDNQSFAASLKSTSSRDPKNGDSGHRSLADHLAVSCSDNTLNTPDRLSEDIVRCISSIYCKLANHPQTHSGLSASPTTSFSSSSIFSSKNRCDSWSPHCIEDAAVCPQLEGLKEDSGPYAAMIEVLKISLDDDSFNFAAKMLQNFRSLVRILEKVDPRKMKREEKLAFWINIHNALVMHAYLAYGIHNRLKSTSIFKASYNVGGHCINAHDIQVSILGIRSHYATPWLATLFYPGRKFKTGSIRHIYALEYPEPLVHFALCSGAYSDPPVRAYTAKNIFQDLRLAKEEFIQTSVHINKETKVYLPKILYYYSKDMSLSMHGLLEVIHENLSEVQQKAIKKCIKGRVDKCIHWLPPSLTFRYVIHAELAKGRTTV
ncbi:uncharacterized protein LOC126712670 [Quercus robur]|uniref:uncharacterized protein LOC126712670 n=1 Tax=Quercus robur TaxID=38942 RepID=UPI002161808E|nr:uncharacterized protein LOC126712670 [Quercus robur]XP_050268056.1 uncharacterized protein LOC126712670 [Quercus robur]XP_050268057.1 uncharacterized protein LOC126712670 [Quercus robur]XP_050268058.1 uncharacterized protein LOC126712670 [Quercus robur]